ncbi:hypothetical protein EV401DRAFT_360634 [Pisolithus croceorrhizus]|nr:hypothetical protein EV401DRAFT_360634 [Pisolithus croceorrhizus]
MYVAFLSSFYGFSLFYKINNIHIHFLLVGLRVSFFFSPTVNMVDVFYAPSPLFSFTSPTSTIPLIFFSLGVSCGIGFALRSHQSGSSSFGLCTVYRYDGLILSPPLPSALFVPARFLFSSSRIYDATAFCK